MSDFFDIGFFQFDNLVRNRVPFVLFHEPVDFTDLYEGLELDHLQRWAFMLKPDLDFEDVMTELQQRRLDLRTPAVIMSATEGPNREIMARLEEAGFSNIYGVEKGGWEAMVKEAKASF